MAARSWSSVAALIALAWAHGAIAQGQQPGLTPVGEVILQSEIARNIRLLQNPTGQNKPLTFPLAMCTFPGGLCGAVRSDGSVAVPPRYDWVGVFSDNRAAVRLGGLYGFVDDEGREVVPPRFRIVGDYKFGFAQVDVDGRSGVIDRDGKMVIAPTYGSIEAIGPDRFRVSDIRQRGGTFGAEDFSGMWHEFSASGGFTTFRTAFRIEGEDPMGGVIDISGRLIEPPRPPSREFDKDDPSIRWVRRDKLWGLARADGIWLIEPRFEQVDRLSGGLARVTRDGKTGFIDQLGHVVIEPIFDKAERFIPDFDRTGAERDGIVGVIDQSGAWVLQTSYQEIRPATAFGIDPNSPTVFGWNFKKGERWGLLDLDGRVVLDADFDQPLLRCADGQLVAYKHEEWFYYEENGSPLQPQDGRLVDRACGATPPYTSRMGDKFGLVDAHSRPLTPVHFDAVARAGPGVENVKIDGKWGRVGADGHWLFEPKFDYLSGGIDVFVASVDGKRGVMRSDGSWLIEPTFEAASLRGNTAFVTLAGATGLLRLSDRSWVIPPRPGVMCDAQRAIMWRRAGTRALLSQTGETWIDIGAERVSINLDGGLVTFLKDGKWGLVDTSGQVIVGPMFDEPVYFQSDLRGIAWAKRDGSWCAIDRRGRRVPGIACADADPMASWNVRFECRVEP